MTIAFTGDINFRDYRSKTPFAEVRDLLAAPDLSVGNLEGILLDDPVDAYREARINITASAKNARYLKDAGIDVFGLANNHTWDHGADGLAEHLTHLGGLVTFGAGTNDAAARAAYRHNHNLGCVSLVPATLKSNKKPPKKAPVFAATYDRRDLSPLIARLQAEHDAGCFVIAWVHAGKEKAAIPTLETQADFRALAAVADLVVGHHPHVLQGVEQTAHGTIVYSLGNFLFINKAIDKRRSGILELALLKRDGHLVIDELALRPIMIDAQSYLPRPATTREADDTLAVMRERSAPFGTRVRLADGRIVFDLTTPPD